MNTHGMLAKVQRQQDKADVQHFTRNTWRAAIVAIAMILITTGVCLRVIHVTLKTQEEHRNAVAR